jgi:hypothetical protein
MTGAPGPDFADRSPLRRPWFMAAAAVGALIVAGGVVVALLPPPQRDVTTPPTASPGSSTAPPASQPSGGAALPTALPTMAPEDVSWQLVGQTAVPVSRSAGPTNMTATATGFAHTPVGALIAAAQISTRSGYSAGRSVWEPTIDGQFVPGPDRDRLLAALRAVGDAAAGPGELSQIAGYLYQSYTPETAVIGLVYRAPAAGTPTYHVLTVTLRWIDGDWRMVAPPGGSWTSVNRAATDLTGVVEWGAR